MKFRLDLEYGLCIIIYENKIKGVTLMRVYYFICTVDAILSIITYTYLRVHFAWSRSWIFILGFCFLMLNMIGCRLLPATTPAFITKLSAWLSGLWIAFLYYILLFAILHTILHIIDKFIHFNLPHTKIASIALALIIGIVAWGTWRAFHPTIRIENISSSKISSKQSYKIVFLTDIHLGQILGRSYAEKLVKSVNEQKPDLVLISGDLLDERIKYLERENTLEALTKLQSKFGTYMAYGNHDYLDRPELWQQLLEQTGIHVLRNKEVIIDKQLKITGINDWSREKSTDALMNLSKNNHKYYSILMDHQPRRLDAAAQASYDMYLAGHTHTGQLFPNRLITKGMYKLDYGRLSLGNMTAITNNGYGFWGPPVRTEVAPEMIVIYLKGK